MKVGEILRNLADAIDTASATKSAEEMMAQAQQAGEEANALAQQAAQEAMAQVVDQAPEPEEVYVDNGDGTDTGTMVPPLQQKHELLKQAGDIPNNVDFFAQQGEECCDEPDELALIKSLAGIGDEQVDQNVAGSIGPVEINPKKNAALAQFAHDDYNNE